MTARPAVPLRVGVVGAGRVGAVLGAALAAAGHPVTAVSARSGASRARAAALLPGVPVVPVGEVAAGADLVLVAVPDGALPDVAAALADGLHPGHLVVHTSGRHGLAVLDPVRATGARALAVHPVLPFSGTPRDLAVLPGVSYGVTARPDDLPAAESLVRALGGQVVHVAERDRALWHAGLAHAANHLTALVASSADLLRAAGAADPDRVLRPLLQAALDGALERGGAALTGPVARGDADTVRAHLAVLSDVAPEVLPSYLALARLTAGRALDAGLLEPDRAAPLLDVLGGVAS